ncbi:MAG: hypothetical protein IT258_24255 [Saprospiraceae bacterium]|nr:hypothetical protein [Saprospiraceae bacterium]
MTPVNLPFKQITKPQGIRTTSSSARSWLAVGHRQTTKSNNNYTSRSTPRFPLSGWHWCGTPLDKYADDGIENLESLDVLKVRPLTHFGSPIEILREFGGKERFLAAVRELEGEIYRVA